MLISNQFTDRGWKKMRKHIVAMLLGLALLFTSMPASAVLIDFDDGYTGSLGNYYDSSGVVFDNGWLYDNYGSNVSAPGQVYGEANNSYNGVSSGDIVAHFVLAGTATNAVTDSMSLWATWLDSGVTVATLDVFNIGGSLIGSVSAAGADEELLSLSIAGIHSFVVSFAGTVGTCGGLPCDDINAIDNLNFNTTAAVPEPATLLLFGSGLIGLVFFRRKEEI